MTALKQNFTTEVGDSALPIFTVRDGSGNPIDLTGVQNIIWRASRDPDSASVVDKELTTSPPGITIVSAVGGQFSPIILPADTPGLSGFYFHKAIVFDIDNNPSTVALGRWQVGPKPLATYSGDPTNSDRDAVRFWIDDTDVDNAQIMDAEVDYTLTLFPNALLAAANCARKLAGKYARKVNKRVGDLSINYSDISKKYEDLADSLQAQGDTIGLIPYGGGLSRADMEAVRSNTDRVRPFFSRKLFDDQAGPNNTSSTDWETENTDTESDGS